MDPTFSHKFNGMTQNLLRYLIYFFVFANVLSIASSFGYDSANSCSPNGKLSRRGRAQMLASIPCDLTSQVYCQLPGSSYPWHAVRRFVHENQGLMKRMYGDVRHISILREEIQNNKIEFEDIEMAADRYSRGGFSRSSRFVHKSYPENMNMEPYFQPISTTPTSELKLKSSQSFSPSSLQESSVQTLNSSTANTQSMTIAESADITSNEVNKSFDTTNKFISREDITENVNYLPTNTNNTDLLVEGVEDNSKDSISIELLSEDEEENIAMNSVFEAPTSPQSDVVNGNNIQIVESPILTSNNASSEPTFISTTLKTYQPLNSDKTTIDLPNDNEDRRTTHKQQSHHEQHDIDSKKNVESLNIKSKQNESEQITQSSQVKGFTTTSIQKENQSQHRNKDTHKNTPIEPTSLHTTLSSSTTSATFSTVSKKNNDLLSGEKLQKHTKSPAAVSATATKPVLRDGQLFQDTMKQEPTSVPNMRGVNACPVKEEVVAPFWANNTRGEVLALLNLYPFEQYVHWEKCTYEYKQMYCREGCRCEQQYRLHRLLAYDPHNECRGIFSDWFRFPSCCICKCYDVPLEFRATSRSPRAEGSPVFKHPIEIAEENVKKAIYEHATEEWYRPKDEFDLFEG